MNADRWLPSAGVTEWKIGMTVSEIVKRDFNGDHLHQLRKNMKKVFSL